MILVGGGISRRRKIRFLENKNVTHLVQGALLRVTMIQTGPVQGGPLRVTEPTVVIIQYVSEK
jgi:hypothetical protein